MTDEKEIDSPMPEHNGEETKNTEIKPLPKIGLWFVFVIVFLSVVAVLLSVAGNELGHIEDRSTRSLSFFFIAEIVACFALLLVYKRRKPDLLLASIVALLPVTAAVRIAMAFFHLMSPNAEIDKFLEWPANCTEIVAILDHNKSAEGNNSLERVNIRPSSFSVYFDENGVKTLKFTEINGSTRVVPYELQGLLSCKQIDGGEIAVLPKDSITVLSDEEATRNFIEQSKANNK